MGINLQDVLAQDPEMLRRKMYQQDMQQYNPQGTAAGAIGALLGSGVGNVASGRGFFETNNPALQKVTKLQKLQSEAMQEGAGDPVKTLETLSARLIEDPELAPFAMQVQEQLLQFKDKAAQQRRAGLQEQKAEADVKKAELSAAQEEQLRKELTELGPNATEDQIMSVVTKYGTPDKILTALASKQTRAAALAQSRELAEQRLELQRQNMEIRRQMQQDKGQPFTPAQKRTDALFAKEYSDYVVGGGASTVDKSLSDLDKAIAILENNPSVTGKLVGAVNTLGDTALAAAYPKAAEAKDLVGGVAQSNLKAILGGQFAAKEGEALLARAYNPGAPVSDNLKRLRSLRQQIQIAKNDKEQAIDYFEDKGTLANFKRSASKPFTTSPSSTGQPPVGVDPAIWNVMTPSERSLWEKK